MSGRPAVPARRVVLVAGGLSLLGGLYAALLRLGLTVPAPGHLEAAHGPVLVLGFVGTLVALERAVALGTGWALLAPACAGTGGLVLLAAGPAPMGMLLLSAGGVLLMMTYAALWRRRPSVALLSQTAGAFAWYAATLLWLGGFSVAETVPWLVGFVVLTIAGERLELAPVGMPAGAQPWLLAVLAAVVAGLLAVTLWPDTGYHLFGLALLALVAWLVVYDVARRTLRRAGLPRYVAVGLLAGYGWLAVAGLLWAGAGPVAAGPRYDATLHAVFLGFTFSMILVHAPVILPAVLRRPLPYHPVLYLPLTLLHLSLLVRLGVGDLLDLDVARHWSGIANIVAVAAFLVFSLTLTVRASRRTTAAAGSARPGTPVGTASSGVPR